MTAPLLGIAIPAYRRPDQLRRCLLSIVASIRQAGDPEVTITVADDSCDETNLAVMAELSREYPRIVHRRNPRNLGVDGNIVHCVDLCEARNVWIIGEDDRMIGEAVGTVQRVLQEGDWPFVYVNYTSVDEEISVVLAERSLAIDRDREMEADEFFATCAWSMGFIGACVVRKEAWSSVSGDRYLGTWFAHAGRILQSLRGGRVRLIAAPLVLNRCGSPRAFTWAASSFEVLEGWARMVDLLRGVYPVEVCDRAAEAFCRAHALGTLRSFCYLRADGLLNASSHRDHVREGPYPALNRRLAWLIARAPPALFRAMRRGLMAVRRKKNRRLSGF